MIIKSRIQNKQLAALLIVVLIGVIPLGFFIAARSVTPAPGSTRVVQKDGMTQVYIPAGSFTMGSPEETMWAECQKYRGDCLRGFYHDMEPPHTELI